MKQKLKNKDNSLHIRRSIQKIEESIQELEKAKFVLISMLPKKKVDMSSCVINLPNGKVIDYQGREIKNGHKTD